MTPETAQDLAAATKGNPALRRLLEGLFEKVEAMAKSPESPKSAGRRKKV